MKIHQVSVTYQTEQDRLLVRINTSNREELRLWFTRRLMVGLWPLVNRFLTDQLVKTEASITSGAAASDDMKHMLADFRRETLLQQADFSTPYQAEQASLPLGEAPLLVTDVNLTPRTGGPLRMEFVEKPEQTEGPTRQSVLEMDARLLQGFVHLLQQALERANWALLPLRPAAPATEPADDAPPPAAPRYLN